MFQLFQRFEKKKKKPYNFHEISHNETLISIISNTLRKLITFMKELVIFLKITSKKTIGISYSKHLQN